MISLGPEPPATPMYVVIGTIRVKAEHLGDFVEQVREHASKSRREPGCLVYDVLQDRDDRQTICLYEVFRSEADLHRHHEQAHYKQWMEVSRDWRDHSAYGRRVLDRIFPPDDGVAAVRS